MKLEDNSINTFQAAVTGTHSLGLVMIPCCQLQASRAVPKLQAPVGTQRQWTSSWAASLLAYYTTHTSVGHVLLWSLPGWSYLGNATSPKSGDLILQTPRRSKPFMNKFQIMGISSWLYGCLEFAHSTSCFAIEVFWQNWNIGCWEMVPARHNWQSKKNHKNDCTGENLQLSTRRPANTYTQICIL